MVAEIELVMRVMEERRNNKAGSDLVTRDFLGVCAVDVDDAKDAVFELGGHNSSVPAKIYPQKKSCPLEDLNLFPTMATATSTTSPRAAPYAYQSVCTIEKVKSALERLERESQSKQSRIQSDISPSSSSITSSSTKRKGVGVDDNRVEQGDGCDSSGGLLATACSRCLLYVLISKDDPRCPKCNSQVHAPPLKKKPRIDLNVDLLHV